MKAVIVYNPRAGRFETTHMLQSVSDGLHALGWSVDVWLTTRPGDAGRLARMARDGGADGVFVAGGDGSVGAVAHELAGSDVALGVLPVGTANVWASELGLFAPLHPWSDVLKDAAMRQVQGVLRRIDVGRCNARCFLMWAGLGLDAHIVNKVEPRSRFVKRFGRVSYVLKALWSAIGWRGVHMTIRSEDAVLESEMLVAVATNIRMYGGRLLRLDAAARVDDGQMALWAFEGHTFLDAYKYLRALMPYYEARATDEHHLVGSRFEIEAARPVNLQLDGEVMGRVTRVEIEVLPAALNVFMPQARTLPIFSA